MEARSAPCEGVQDDIARPPVSPEERLDQLGGELPPPAQQIGVPPAAGVQERLRHGGRVEGDALQHRAVGGGPGSRWRRGLGHRRAVTRWRFRHVDPTTSWEPNWGRVPSWRRQTGQALGFPSLRR